MATLSLTYTSSGANPRSGTMTLTYEVVNTSNTQSCVMHRKLVVTGNLNGGEIASTFQDDSNVLNAISAGTFTYDSAGKCYTRTTSAQTKTVTLKWTKNVNGATTVLATKSANVSIPALPSYTISYNANGGTGTVSSQTKYYGVSLALRSNSYTRTNYVFKNWNTKADGSGTSYSAGATYTGNAALTLYAQWYAPYTVSYNANGGSGAPSAQTKVYNKALTLSSTKPTKTGYTFSKWNTKSDGSGTNYNSGASYTANAALALYAQYTANTWYVNYNGNGFTGGSTAKSTHTYDTAKTLTANGFSRAYTVTYKHNYTSCPSDQTATATYSFSKWNTKSDGTGTDYANQASVKNLTSTAGGTVNLYARWTSASVTLISPSRTGYTFGGWYKEAACTNKVGNAIASYTPTADISLYAKWTINTYTISYDANSGTGAPASQTKTHGTALTLSTAKPTRTDCKFLGWSTSRTATTATYSPGGSFTGNSTTTLYAVWAPVPKISSLTAIRCDANGDQDDEGQNANVTAVWSLAGTVNSASTAAATLLNGSTDVSSYMSGATSGNTGGTATAIVPNIDTDEQYTFKFKITVTTGTDTQEVTRSVVLTRSFFTMDFKAGGKGVGIFSAAPSDGLIVGKATTIQGSTSVRGSIGVYASNINRDDAAPSSTQYSTEKIVMRDVDGESLFYLEGVRSTASAITSRIVAVNEVGGNQYTSSLWVTKPQTAENNDGSLTWLGNNFNLRARNIDRDGELPSETQYGPYLYFQDKDTETLGYIQTYREPSGVSGIRIYGSNEYNSSTVSNGLTLYVRADGTRGVAFSEAAPWRTALGLGTSGALPITIGQGGTGATSAANARTNLAAAGTGVANTFTAHQNIKSSGINRDGSAPSSDAWGGHWTVLDNDGETIAAFGSVQRTDRGIDAYMFAYNEKTDGTEVSNGIYARVAKDGTQSYYVTAPAAFRSAIGVGGLGTIVTGSTGDSAVSTAKETYVDLCNFTLAAGKWAVFATVEFATNATGRRVAVINTTAGGTGISLQWRVSGPTTSGGPTRLRIAGVLQPSASTKYYLSTWQNSGGALNVYGTVQAIRII